jgi:NAD(P)-dependent dehydrogenase (short-subunit alcohol dehydrogenase family)
VIDRRVALVTGGTRGIGRAVTERLTRDGWQVTATYRRNHDAAAEVASSTGATVVQADTSTTDGGSLAVSQVLDVHGQLDHLVTCAAITHDTPVADLGDEEWDDVIGTNLSGVFRVSRAALRPISASSRGRIVLVSSIAATMGNAGQAAYAAAKAGLTGFGRTLARELAMSGTTVNIVLPGPTANTGITETADQTFVNAIARRIPLGRLGEPAEVAHIIRMLLDDAAAFTTGVTIAVDGGLSM